jgi:hypothetical protein
MLGYLDTVDLDSTGGVDDAALSALFMRAAEALDQSAALAEWGVRWQERAGRHAAAEKEAGIAARAREAARCARAHAAGRNLP